MSQHLYDTAYKNRPIHLTMGWDRRLQELFFNVQELDPSDEDDVDDLPITDISVGRDVTIADCYRSLKQLGLQVPATFFQGVAKDARTNVGNRIVAYQPDGSFTVRYDESSFTSSCQRGAHETDSLP